MCVPDGDGREAGPWFNRFLVLEAGEVSRQVRGRVLAGRAEIAFELQEYDILRRSAQESLELSRACGDDFIVPTALRVIGQAALRAGRFDDGVSYIDEAIPAAEAACNDLGARLTLAAKSAIPVRHGTMKSG